MIVSFNHALEQGSAVAFLLAFVAGIFASLTPCVYPMIPITVSFIGKKAKSHVHAVELSLVYVLGMALMYSGLGIFAGLTGKIFGVLTINSTVFAIVGSIIIIFGVFEMGWIKLPIPGFVTHNRFTKGKGGALVMGMTAGLIAAPCTVPVLGVILTFIASRQSIVFGGLLMFVFALGMGLLFIALGISTSLIKNLPKSGQWMMTLEKITGLFFFIIGGYFLYLAVSF